MGSMQSVQKIASHIPGFDLISYGGLPAERTTLVAGTSGSAKTVFAVQFLAMGIRQGGSGVFVTFEESPDDIRRNMLSLGWDIAEWEAQGKWAFVDASPMQDVDIEEVFVGSYDLSGLMARIRGAAARVGANRVSLDSIGAIFTRYDEADIIRRELFRIVATLKEIKVTSIMTAERLDEYGAIARYGVEEFVSDNVIILRNAMDGEKRRRTIEILKFRGATHQRGEFPFTILAENGIVVLPLSAIELKQKSSNVRIPSGVDELDTMCGGGFFRDSIVLVSGATGTGKTLISTQFIAGGAKEGERCLLFAFEESREQLLRNAQGWGVDFEALEQAGNLRIVCTYPEVLSLDDHLLAIQQEIETFNPQRIAIDSLSALERVASMKSFREFIIGLTSFVKHRETAGLFTATTPGLFGGESITEAHISTITDSIILLRYVEVFGEMRRGLTVLKMRGSQHDKEIREVTIDGGGMRIGKPFRHIGGILSGRPTYFPPDEIRRIDSLFQEEQE